METEQIVFHLQLALMIKADTVLSLTRVAQDISGLNNWERKKRKQKPM